MLVNLQKDIPIGVTHDELDLVQNICVGCQSNHLQQ